MKNFYVPERFKGRTGYQIFVDRYSRSGQPVQKMEGRRIKDWNDSVPDWEPDADGVYRNEYFYGGNLQGIIQKLDEIDSLGFDLIYLSPISKTHTNHHYDAENQLIIDPYIGNWDDFRKLCEEAHKRNILVCVDLVFNHMGARSEAFQEAIRGNPNYVKWFEWDSRGNPVYWYDFKDMPQCNKLNSEYQEYTFEVAKKYIQNGADGIRLDLGEILPVEFLRNFRNNVKKLNEEILIVNEMWDLDTHRRVSQLDGTQADSVMNYPLSDAIIRWIRWKNVPHIEYTLSELAKYPNNTRDILWNILDSHDTPRLANMLVGEGMNREPFAGRVWDIEQPWRGLDSFDTYGFRKWGLDHDEVNKEKARADILLASSMQYMQKGIPIVYYGTEVGLCGNKDPFNRKPYPWNNIDYLLYHHYAAIGFMRKRYREIFTSGEQQESINEETMKIIRSQGGHQIVMWVNPTEHEVRVNDIDNGGDEILNIKGCSSKVLSPKGVIAYYYD